MSAQNGQRARFQRDRKRRVVRRMHLRAVLLEINEKKAAGAAAAAPPAATPPARRSKGPALEGK
jgi:hypothetical protein